MLDVKQFNQTFTFGFLAQTKLLLIRAKYQEHFLPLIKDKPKMYIIQPALQNKLAYITFRHNCIRAILVRIVNKYCNYKINNTHSLNSH